MPWGTLIACVVLSGAALWIACHVWRESTRRRQTLSLVDPTGTERVKIVAADEGGRLALSGSGRGMGVVIRQSDDASMVDVGELGEERIDSLRLVASVYPYLALRNNHREVVLNTLGAPVRVKNMASASSVTFGPGSHLSVGGGRRFVGIDSRPGLMDFSFVDRSDWNRPQPFTTGQGDAHSWWRVAGVAVDASQDEKTHIHVDGREL